MAEHPPGQLLPNTNAVQPWLISSQAFAFLGNQVESVLQARRDAKEQARRDRLAAEEAERILVSDSEKQAPS